MNPMLSLVEGLSMRGHEVKVFGIIDGSEKFKSRCGKLGVEYVGLDIGMTMDEIHKKMHSQGKMHVAYASKVSKPATEKALADFEPDVVVSDFTNFASHDFAHERDIPHVINWPGPLDNLKTFVAPPDWNTGRTFAGIYVAWVRTTIPGVLVYLNLKDLGTVGSWIRSSVGRSLTLVNCFFGLEAADQLPPHIKMLGPIAPPLPEKVDFGKTHLELEKFLAGAKSEGSKVLVVTTGSLVELEQWLVELMFKAFKQVEGAKIVWSLKEEQQAWVDMKDTKFHISSWLPQPMLLASDSVHGVLSHCGFGGVMECIVGGKPVVVLPFCLDQMDNARLLMEAGAATQVGNFPSFNTDMTGRQAYKPGSLSAERITAGVQELLGSDSYLKAAKRLQGRAKAPGHGCAAACDHIESAARIHVKHLLNHKQHKRNTGGAPIGLVVFLGALACVLMALKKLRK